ncbi:hypothetical protein GNF85_23705 [Clostridium perfringens]
MKGHVVAMNLNIGMVPITAQPFIRITIYRRKRCPFPIMKAGEMQLQDIRVFLNSQ